MKTTFFRKPFRRSALIALIALFGVINAFAQASDRPDKIMTIGELRTCLTLKSANEKAAADILQIQQSFKRDQDAIKAEQLDVDKVNDELRARSNKLSTEREAINAQVSALSAKAPRDGTVSTDAEKADYDAERAKLIEKSRLHNEDTQRFNATQQTQRSRVDALNERVNAINVRSSSVNDRVEPHQKQMTAWQDQCRNRRFREEDEIAIKKEIAAGK